MNIDLPPPGFRGLDPTRLLTVYRRHLPHWRQAGATYFVTFRVADSLPQERLTELKADRDRWMALHPDPSDMERMGQWQEEMERIEHWLDQGFGSCVLRHAAAADLVEGAMHHFDDARYALFAAIVMPNHAHVVLRPEEGHPLERILESWKKFSSRQIHEMLGGQGTLWQDESYDRIVRDTEELRRVIRYMKTNEQQIGGRRNMWLTPSWEAWWNLGSW